MSPSALAALLSDTLHDPIDAVAPLARILSEKTHGNPFFVGQVLLTLFREKLLRCDVEAHAWRYDEAAIAARLVSEDVVAFMADKLRKLPPSSQRALSFAACIGHVFDIATLSIVGKEPPFEIARALGPAIEDGLLLPLDPDYRFVQSALKDGRPPSAETAAVRYRFLHDRVQQAAYSLIDEVERPGVHLHIGRLLVSRHRGTALDTQLFDVVSHWNRGIALLTDDKERHFLAELNLRAGQKAKAALAFQSGAEHLRIGLSLLDSDLAPSVQKRELGRALRRAWAECELLAGHFDLAELLLNGLLSEASEPLVQAELHNLRVVLYTAAGRFADALAAGTAGLKLLGVELPVGDTELQEALGREFSAVAAILEARGIATANMSALIDAPQCRDRRVQLLLRALTHITPVIYITGPMLYPLVIALHVRASLEFGHTEVSAYGYMAYAFILSVGMGRHAEARAFGEMALAVDEQFGGRDLRGKLYATLSGCGHFFLPLPEVVGYARKAHQSCLESGDFLYASYSCYAVTSLRLGMGDDLVAVREELESFLRVTQRTREPLSNNVLSVHRQLIAALRGETKSALSLDSLDGESFLESTFLAETSPTSMGQALLWFYLAKALLAYLREDAATALSMTAIAEPYARGTVGTYGTTELLFYGTLARLGHAFDCAGDERARLIAEAQSARGDLAKWAISCPTGYSARLAIVDGELHWLSNEPLLALDCYEQAIHAARAENAAQLVAISSELAARLCQKQGSEHRVRGYLLEAHAAYLRWGALARVKALREAHPSLFSDETATPKLAFERAATS